MVGRDRLVSVKQAHPWNTLFIILRRPLIHLLSWCIATRRGRVIYLLAAPWLLLLAWLTSVAWFLTDDAFISFRYVRNLLEGHGLVFNPGEYVEGYTNFLWILELAALWGLFDLRPEHAANWLSVAYTGATLARPLVVAGPRPHPSRPGLPRLAGLGPARQQRHLCGVDFRWRAGNATVHLLPRRGRGLLGGASPPALGPAGRLLEPGRRGFDAA